MTNKEFLLQRISIYAGVSLDPDSDEEVGTMLRRKFNVFLPQRRSMDDSLRAAISDHEIIALILQYRAAPAAKTES